MGTYRGKVDDYLRATVDSLEAATTDRTIVIYDPDTLAVDKIDVDVSDKGADLVDKAVSKANKEIVAAQAELAKTVARIRENGGGRSAKKSARRNGKASKSISNGSQASAESLATQTVTASDPQPVH